MNQENISLRQPQESALMVNKVLRNTYLLLSLSLLFSAAMAGVAMITNAPPMGFLTLIVYFGLLMLTNALRNSSWGIAAVFALTGFMGFTLGPILNFYIATFSNGSQLIMTALGGTGVIFLGLSGYALTTRKDFSYLGGFLFVGILVAFLASLAGLFFNMPMLQLVVSAAFVLLSSGLILFQTSQIIHGGERNYIMATITLYVSLYNLFLSLLQIFAALSGNRD